MITHNTTSLEQLHFDYELEAGLKPNYHIQLSGKADDPEWDAFLARTPGGHHAQTSLWGRVKAMHGWKIIRLVIRQGERIIAGAQILMRPTPIIGSVGYIPKGPVIASNDPGLPKLVFNEMRKLVKVHRIHYLILQPPDNGPELTTQLRLWGFRSSSIKAFPTATVLIDLRQNLDTILANMKSKTRYNIRLAQRKGITVRKGIEDDIPTFYRILVATSQRQNFSVYPERYYSELGRVFGQLGHFKIFLAEYQDQAVSAMFTIAFGDTVLFKRGGWSGQYGNYRPNEIMHWTAIQWAKSQGYHYYNFEGIDPLAAKALLQREPIPASLKDSVTRFKIGFGGLVVCLPDVYDYVHNPLLRWAYYSIYPKIAELAKTKGVANRFRTR